MMFVVHIVICASIGLACAIPTNYKGPLSASNDNAAQKLVTSDNSNIVNHVVMPLEEGETKVGRTYSSHDVIVLPPTSDDTFYEASQHAPYPVRGDGISFNYVPQSPVWSDQYLKPVQENNQASYEDQAPTKVLMDIDMDNYEYDDNSLSNSLLPLEALPNIYSSYVHEIAPSKTHDEYDIDVLNPENTEIMLPNMRPSRSRVDDYIEELAHDAMINNIIPTMSFVRGAEEPVHPALQTAVYPNGATNGCGLPVFLLCNPTVVPGTLARSYPPISANHKVDIEQIDS
ncbi:uncharacterized protein LOC142987799 [Anticarsia gemmatalis]|uniref:uncharacterized protein LOC142987799 n=1 Tax=Anticarsia gemmatalis TaxID=129554 RepID=UPI003F764219